MPMVPKYLNQLLEGTCQRVAPNEYVGSTFDFRTCGAIEYEHNTYGEGKEVRNPIKQDAQLWVGPLDCIPICKSSVGLVHPNTGGVVSIDTPSVD
jgi:hypothetical protein